MTTRYEDFCNKFGQDNAVAIINAAHEHRDSTGFTNYGGDGKDDEFRWAIMAAIGHECITRYRGYHGILASEEDIESWLMEPETLQWIMEHTGDMDYLALVAGVYNKYLDAFNNLGANR